MKFNRNMGAADRALRIIVGLILIGLAAAGEIGVWGYVGIVPLVTAFVCFCPAYALFGLRTCKEC